MSDEERAGRWTRVTIVAERMIGRLRETVAKLMRSGALPPPLLM
ncbi:MULTISPECIES: hypothetical protein [Williamsia]|nr:MULTISPECIES: hypothetical protein [Williamsia]